MYNVAYMGFALCRAKGTIALPLILENGEIMRFVFSKIFEINIYKFIKKIRFLQNKKFNNRNTLFHIKYLLAFVGKSLRFLYIYIYIYSYILVYACNYFHYNICL